jgi:hypothetical protein
MMPHRAMHKQVSPKVKNGLDNGPEITRQTFRTHDDPGAPPGQRKKERPCVFITIATPT